MGLSNLATDLRGIGLRVIVSHNIPYSISVLLLVTLPQPNLCNIANTNQMLYVNRKQDMTEMQ